jgi:putative tricarboxylic transport membrane protein
VSAYGWKHNLLAKAIGLLFGLGGLFFGRAAWRLPGSGEVGIPGPGAAPGFLALILIFCGAVLTVLAFRNADAPSAGAPSAEAGDGYKVPVATLLLLGGALLLEPLGFMLSTFLFLAIGFMYLGNAQWRIALPTAAVVAIFFWLIFTKLLGVGLPYGRIVEILFY